MPAQTFDPCSISPDAARSGRHAYFALAEAAGSYLSRLDTHCGVDSHRYGAMVTRIRGTGPGVSFGSLIDAIQSDLAVNYETPFEGSLNVSGAALPASAILDEDRDDGFLFLRFSPGTRDLPLHIHPRSDRFIFVIGGRGFFHVTGDPLDAVRPNRIRHVPARDRDVFMFRRGVVHTFSTAEHELLLLSYHRPFIALDDDSQYSVGADPLTPAAFLEGQRGMISFDAGWTCLTPAALVAAE
jgi:mannose-6-phosphate isomerase-like protein (cupin superfamily)